jgi:hypothetical protein
MLERERPLSQTTWVARDLTPGAVAGSRVTSPRVRLGQAEALFVLADEFDVRGRL